jgi:hypothetical protein
MMQQSITLPQLKNSLIFNAFFSRCGLHLKHLLGISLLVISIFSDLKLQAQSPETFTSNGSWTCPQGVTRVMVECWGAGGGGGSRSSNGTAGGGGGGAYVRSILNVIPGNSYTIVVGSGGAANSNGGNTSFHTNLVMAEGGKGGSLNNSAGGAGGLGANSIGSFWFNGGTGANGGSNGGGGGGGAGSAANGSNGSNQNGGAGGALNGGNGGGGATSNANGNPGSNYGGGGGGARRSSGTRNGGTGANGLLIVSPIIWQNEITGTNPNASNPYTIGNEVVSNVTVSGISRGSGISGSNANDRYAATGWTTSDDLNTSDYFEFTITPAAGNAINLHSFRYTGQISTGSADHSFRSSVNSYGSDIGSPNTTGTTISLTGAAYQNLTGAITFRFYTHDVSSSSTVFSINDFAFFGSVYPVPTISGFSPGSACTGSGASVTINGSNFTGTTAVRFNGVNATSFNVIGNTQITAILPTGASTGPITVVTPNATATSASNFTVNPLPSFPAPFTASSASVCKGQQNVIYTVPLNAGVTYNWSYSGTGANFSSTSNSVSVNFASNASSGTLSVTASNGCGTSSARTIAITVNDVPNVTITPDYCTGTGYVKLTSSAGNSYLWSTGQNSSFINVDQAGNYQVTITNAAGCTASASIDVAQELVINGNFESGNSGFSTAYTYSTVANGLYPEGTYAINNNANFNHDQFYGRDHTSGNGNFMIINGSPATGATVWSQNNIAVQPNTTYYFSAWGLSVINNNRAVLQFSVNGNQVGTIAYLPNGYSNNSGPYNWVRFYGSWNSGPSTTANLSIINLNTVLGGNDFGLDDISFGTLSPAPLAIDPNANSGGSVCVGSSLFLSANASGGASPFVFTWTGPNGFTSSQQNPVVTNNASSIHNGTYSLTVTDGFGCQVSGNFSITVNTLPLDPTLSAIDATVCSGNGTSIQVNTSESNIYYQLRNDADESEIGLSVNGTGSNILLPTGNLAINTTFNVLAVSSLTGCGRELSNKPSVAVTTTPELVITNQSACSGTVNITNASVTAGSTGGGTLSYWTNAGATVAMTNPTSAGNGTYFIKSEIAGCYDIAPVVVRISSTPATAFSYTGTPFCTTESNPLPTFSGGGVAGLFTATPAGLVFASSSTGEINLAASAGGTYTIRNTITPAGACGTFFSNSTVVITASPVASFQYTSNDLCQSANAVDPVPVFINGGTSGTFTSSFGLNINATTGVIDISECLPGNYAVINTIAATGGCSAVLDTVFIDINPYTFDGSVNTSVTNDVICLGESTQLLSTGSSYLSTLLSEKFNGSINNWISTNNSTGGNVNNAAWTLRPEGYNSDVTFSSNDNSQFYVTHSRDQNGTITNTILRSPQMSTIGYSSLTLNFWHYYNFDAKAGENAKVEVSTNGSTWITVAAYITDQGSSGSFNNAIINLNAYIGRPIFFVRFNYYAGARSRYWAIDNVTISGMSTNYSYDWSSSPAGYSSTDKNPVANPTTNTFYILNATNTYGCSTPIRPVPVTVKQLPVLSSSLTPPAICSGSPFQYTPSSVSNSAVFSWKRPFVSGVSNPAIVISQSGNPNEVLTNTTATPKEVTYHYNIISEGCGNSQNVTVTVNPKPEIVLGGNITVCSGTSVQLPSSITNAQAPITYSWAPASYLNNPTIAQPTAQLNSASETYTLTVTDGNNCLAVSNPVTVTNFGFAGTPGLWTGAVDDDWNNCRNWSDGQIPGSGTNVVLNQTSSNDCRIVGAVMCNSLQIVSNDSNTPDLIIEGSGSLSVTNNITIHKSAGINTIKLIMNGTAQLNCNNLTLTGINSGQGNALFVNESENSQTTIRGNLTINQGGKILLSDGNPLTNDASIQLQGNFTNNGLSSDFEGDLSTLIFTGVAPQIISCPEGQVIPKLVVNNPNPIALILNSSIQIEKSLQLTNGCIDLNGNDLILGTQSNHIELTGQNENAYVLVWKGADNGKVIHQVRSTNHEYFFPIGDLNDYTPFSVTINTAVLVNANISATMTPMAHPEKGTSTAYLNRYWTIEPSGVLNPEYEVNYNYADTDVTGDPASLHPAKFNTVGWQSSNQSASKNRKGNGSVNISQRKLNWAGLNSFSEFTAFGDGSPLPVELLLFHAEPLDEHVEIKWMTASEINNDFFMIQRSVDAVNFSDLERVEGAGNSTVIRKYTTMDKQPLNGISYYRLKQVDFNGTTSYSDIVPVRFNGEEVIRIDELIPDAGQLQIRFRLRNPSDNQAQITIFDAGGKNVYQSSPSAAARNWQGEINIGDLPKGVYIVSFRIKGQSINRKFVY